MNIKTLTLDQLFQALSDARNEVDRMRCEIIERLTEQHPELFPVMQRVTQVALDRPSMMTRSRIR